MTLEMALKEQFQAGEAKGLNAGYENSIAVLRDLKSGMSAEQIAQKYQIDTEKIHALQEFL